MALNELGLRLGSTVVASSAIGWGDARATFRVRLSDGRDLAARRVDGTDPSAVARHRAAVMERLAGAGLPVPTPEVTEAGDAVWLTSAWIDGETGAAWLDTPERARRLATSMGRLARQLRVVDATGLGLDGRPATSQGHAERASAWLAAAAMDLRPEIRGAIDGAITWLAAADRWNPVFVHGDFAPINVIVAPDGGIRGLLDLEHSELGSPVADTAWWSWVVRHHHPKAWSASWATFLGASGFEAVADGHADAEMIRATMLVRLLRSVVDAPDTDSRRRWAIRLDEAAAW